VPNAGSGTDLTTLLLEVFRRRANRLTPAEVMSRYRTDRFVAPDSADITALHRTEDMLLSALPDVLLRIAGSARIGDRPLVDPLEGHQ
jgi:hypothetical protein